MQYIRTLAAVLFALGLVQGAAAEQLPYTIGTYPQEMAGHWLADSLPVDDALNGFATGDEGVAVLTESRALLFRDGGWQAVDPANYSPIPDRAVSRPDGTTVLIDVEGALRVAPEGGSLEAEAVAGYPLLEVNDGMGRTWGTHDVRALALDNDGRLWFACLAGVAQQTDEGWKFYTGPDGLPYNDFTSMDIAPNGDVWFGTTIGAIRYDGEEWHYRQGRRWLPGDHIKDVHLDEESDAWFVTDGGIGRIYFEDMTLSEKAAFYEEEMDMIRRTEWGYVAEASLTTPGDKTSEIIHHDSDNDGLWTSMYGAGVCYAYGATGDPKAKERAKAVFEALRFLQKVTQGGDHSPPLGYVARTVLPIDAPDPNDGRIERDREKQETDDAMWKVYEPRWPVSADGEWYWKSDTSSDELDGHYFFYPLYHDLVAETEEEKARVVEVVRDLTDHLVAHNYALMEHDGTATRWAVFSPDQVNKNVNWIVERGLNSLSMLSYLTVAHYLTDDEKYVEHMEYLMDEHDYHANAMYPKMQFGMGSGNQSDDEMAFMSFYNLIKYTKNEDLKARMLYSFYGYWMLEEPELNPFFNFTFAAVGREFDYTNPWGTHKLGIWEGWLEDSMGTLIGFPLDRLDWASKNSHRLDLQKLPRQQSIDAYDGEGGRGYRIDGDVLPVENRHFNHYNTDPWRLDYGGNGRTLGNGTVFLLPYYMGLYYDFIEDESL